MANVLYASELVLRQPGRLDANRTAICIEMVAGQKCMTRRIRLHEFRPRSIGRTLDRASPPDILWTTCGRRPIIPITVSCNLEGPDCGVKTKRIRGQTSATPMSNLTTMKTDNLSPHDCSNGPLDHSLALRFGYMRCKREATERDCAPSSSPHFQSRRKS
jgi:hypothetical protein